MGLLGATITGDNPGYFPVKNRRLYPLVLSMIVLAVLIVGLAVMRQDRGFWWPVLAPRAWALMVLGAVAITTLVVALTQRPRPDYLYGLNLIVLVLVGFSLSALLRRLGGTAFVAAFTAGAILVLCAAVPSYYQRGPRPLHDALVRLQLIRQQLQQPNSVLVTSGYNFEICAYLAATINQHCTSPDWATLRAQVTRGRSLRDVLDEANATAIYADPGLQADPAVTQLLASSRSAGWRQVAAGIGDDGPWSVLTYSGGSSSSPSVPVGAGRAPSALRHLPDDLKAPNLVYSGLYVDGWLKKDAYIELAGGTAANLAVRAQVLPLASSRRQHLQLLLNGRTLASKSVPPGLLDLQVRVPATRSNRRIELRWSATAPISPTDRRQAAALLVFLGPRTAHSALRRLPADLANPDLAFSGIYLDGWTEKTADVVLAGGPAAELVLRAQALPLEGGRRQHLQVIQNGKTVASGNVKPGLLELHIPLPASRSDRRIELRWAGTTQIGPNDRRQGAALLKFLGVSSS